VGGRKKQKHKSWSRWKRTIEKSPPNKLKKAAQEGPLRGTHPLGHGQKKTTNHKGELAKGQWQGKGPRAPKALFGVLPPKAPRVVEMVGGVPGERVEQT